MKAFSIQWKYERNIDQCAAWIGLRDNKCSRKSDNYKGSKLVFKLLYVGLDITYVFCQC